MAQWRYVSPKPSSLSRKVKVPQARMSMCAVLLVKDALPTGPCPSPPSKKGHSNGEATELIRARSAEASQMTCHAWSWVLQGIQCGNADAMPREATAVGGRASARASTKTHTANRRSVFWPSCLLEVRRASITRRVVGGSHLPYSRS